MGGPLRNRDHQGPRHTITVSHNVTIFVPEPRLCPQADMRSCPETVTAITECDSLLSYGAP